MRGGGYLVIYWMLGALGVGFLCGCFVSNSLYFLGIIVLIIAAVIGYLLLF